MALKENLPLALLGLISCSSQPNEGVSQIVENCVAVSEDIKMIHPDYPTGSDVLLRDFHQNIEMAASVLKLRYAPRLTEESALRFKKDFTDYLQTKKITVNVCRTIAEPKLLVDFVDSFVMEHPNYEFLSQTSPIEPFDHARFSTLRMWKNEEIVSIMGRTLRYQEAFSLSQEQLGQQSASFHFPELRQYPSTPSELDYTDTTRGVHYAFVYQPASCLYFSLNSYCGEPVLLARATPDASYTLSVAVEGILSYLKTRGECFGRC